MSIKWRWGLIFAIFAILIVFGYFLVSGFILALNEGPRTSVLAGPYANSSILLRENELLFLGGLVGVVFSGLALAWLIFTREDSLPP